MELTSFRKEHIPQAAALFAHDLKKLRRAIPAVPDTLERPGTVEAMLEDMLVRCPGVVALGDGKLAGYLLWYIIDHFRGSDRRGAYIPEWGHAAAAGSNPFVYRIMYRAASAQWATAGCQVHALTLFASDRSAEEVWYWSGFGLAVIDAVRVMQPLGVRYPQGYTFRKASSQDASAFVALDAAHRRHYSQPPVFMPPQNPSSPSDFEAFIQKPKHSVWLAVCGDEPVGFIQFEETDFGSANVMHSETSIYITGTYFRPEQRGLGAAAALLDAAIQDYARQGFQRCVVDFESFNPEAAAFWMKYFEPVCRSLMRIPET